MRIWKVPLKEYQKAELIEHTSTYNIKNVKIGVLPNGVGVTTPIKFDLTQEHKEVIEGVEVRPMKYVATKYNIFQEDKPKEVMEYAG